MASAAERREARRQKILQNSENRMKVLLGEKTDTQNVRETLNSEAESENVTSAHESSLNRRLHEPDIVKPKELDEVSTASSAVPDGDIPRLLSSRKGSPTVKIQKLSPVPKEIHEPTVNVKKVPEAKPEELWKIFDLLRFGAMILLAVVVRWLLSYGFGLFYVKSIFIPFIATEIAIYAFQQINMQNIVLPQKGSLLSSALMLCGIKPDVIKLYNRVMSYISAISEDCAIYLFTFVLCNIVMALPEE
ncbi:hypothetical protein LOTGIDRAFT_237287 [Lottia gigantea]|uniref:Calcium signal-modulating cyclophilin ligand n=1 Tax=Lottia gigantea TaxID=225164 RepID=V4B325_LOTGI|nr:hypothetical protein LOTGIDRAFT_237287 [Lottia gigantea]ESP04633.1 hypothetical protein LOTGIDRAFT_237287 [Lottia gigantea]